MIYPVTTSDQVTHTRGVGRHWPLMHYAVADSPMQEGFVPTRSGFVRVRTFHGATTMEFLWGGRAWVRKWPTVWGKKTLTRLAKAFAFEISHNESPYPCRNGRKEGRACLYCDGPLPTSLQARNALYCCDEHRNAFTSGARRLAFNMLDSGEITIERIRKAANQ